MKLVPSPEQIKVVRELYENLMNGRYDREFIKGLAVKYRGRRDDLSDRAFPFISQLFSSIRPRDARTHGFRSFRMPRGAELYAEGGLGRIYRVGPRTVAKVEPVNALQFCHPLMHSEIRRSDPLHRAVLIRDISERAAALGVGPRVHGFYVSGKPPDQSFVTVMDLVEGETWKEWVPRSTAAQRSRALRMLNRQIDKLGAAGIMHMDLHNENVMLVTDPSGRVLDVKLVDFGSAVLARDFDASLSMLSEEDTAVSADLWLPVLMAENGIISSKRKPVVRPKKKV